MLKVTDVFPDNEKYVWTTHLILHVPNWARFWCKCCRERDTDIQSFNAHDRHALLSLNLCLRLKKFFYSLISLHYCVSFSFRSKTLAEVQKWLQTLPSHKQKAVNCGSSTLDEPVVKQVEELVEKLKVGNTSFFTLKVPQMWALRVLVSFDHNSQFSDFMFFCFRQRKGNEKMWKFE